MPSSRKPRILAPFALIGASALVVASWAGLARIGWAVGTPPAVDLHGPLMALGFLGTVIGMERAVGLGKQWALGVPALSALGVASLLLGLPDRVGAALIAAAGLALVWVFVVAYRIQPELHITVMGLGAICWAAGALVWVTEPALSALVPWLAGFLVLTIAGERLELTRMTGPRVKNRWILMTAIAVFGLGMTASLWDVDTGTRLAGFGVLGIATWLARYDIARRTIKTTGVTRYMAAALLTGYAWLVIAAVIWIAKGLAVGTLYYDAGVHAVFLGFVISMVFAHAPVIVPAVARTELPYHPRFWIPLVFLHASLLLRIVGDLGELVEARRWGGMLNVVALSLFVIVAVRAAIGGRRPRTRRT